MPDEEPDDSFVSRTARSFQESAERSGPAAGASYTLIGAILVLGGIGYGVDVWRGQSHWFLLGGLLLGLVVGFVDLARVVWKK
jgi:F0F1-type ATP synthase assembly protein I